MRCTTKNVVEEKMKAKWNNQGMPIDGIKDLVIEFPVHAISHKVYTE